MKGNGYEVGSITPIMIIWQDYRNALFLTAQIITLAELPLIADIVNIAVFFASDMTAKITVVTIDATVGTTTGLITEQQKWPLQRNKKRLNEYGCIISKQFWKLILRITIEFSKDKNKK